jgi:hypothetical protein
MTTRLSYVSFSTLDEGNDPVDASPTHVVGAAFIPDVPPRGTGTGTRASASTASGSGTRSPVTPKRHRIDDLLSLKQSGARDAFISQVNGERKQEGKRKRKHEQKYQLGFSFRKEGTQQMRSTFWLLCEVFLNDRELVDVIAGGLGIKCRSSDGLRYPLRLRTTTLPFDITVPYKFVTLLTLESEKHGERSAISVLKLGDEELKVARKDEAAETRLWDRVVKEIKEMHQLIKL